MCFFFQAEDGIRDLVRSRGLGDVYKRQLHWSDLGVASWYDFAIAIHEQACARGLLDGQHALAIDPIATEDYPTPARRPAYSVLDKSRALRELQAQRLHWRVALGAMLDELRLNP